MRYIVILIMTYLPFIGMTQSIDLSTGVIKKDFFVGGSLNYQTSNSGVFITDVNGTIISSGGQSSFSFSPFVAKQLDPYWAIGLRLSYTHSNNEIIRNIIVIDPIIIPPSPSISTSSQNTYLFGVFSRFIINPSSKFQFYLSPYASYAILSNNDTRSSLTVTSNAIGIGIDPGVTYAATERLRVRVSTSGIGYSRNNATDSYSFGAGLNLNDLTFGVEFLF